MLKATVEEAAETFGVTPKTVHEWVREGMPVHKRGSQGAGNRTIIDMARAPEWVRRHQSRGLAPIAEYFLSTNEPNPLRWLVERFQDGVLHAIALAALSWLEEPGTDGKLAWEKAGLTEAQARTMVWHWWGFSSMFIDELKRSQFEQRWIGPETDGADLDDLASLWFSGDIRSRWNDTWAMPECMRRFWPERQA